MDFEESSGRLLNLWPKPLLLRFCVFSFGRRIEDKLDSLHLEMKSVQILFDVSSTHGNRSLPTCSFLKLWKALLFV